MEISINPLDWMTDKERERQKLYGEIVETFNAYKVALQRAAIAASDTRIINKVAEDFKVSVILVRKALLTSGTIVKQDGRGRKPAAAV